MQYLVYLRNTKVHPVCCPSTLELLRHLCLAATLARRDVMHLHDHAHANAIMQIFHAPGPTKTSTVLDLACPAHLPSAELHSHS
jgi:hypothetical protein